MRWRCAVMSVHLVSTDADPPSILMSLCRYLDCLPVYISRQVTDIIGVRGPCVMQGCCSAQAELIVLDSFQMVFPYKGHRVGSMRSSAPGIQITKRQ